MDGELINPSPVVHARRQTAPRKVRVQTIHMHSLSLQCHILMLQLLPDSHRDQTAAGCCSQAQP